MSIQLTKEKLEEYATMLERGEIKVDEFTSGLLAVHGATRVEMNPGEFLNYLESMCPLDQIEMSDELREEFKMMKGR